MDEYAVSIPELHTLVGVQARTEQDEESLVIGMASDVLFDTGSSTLSAAATTSLTEAAKQIQQREPGTVRIVGHTDDVDTDASNQALSERRAEAVAAAKRPLLDEGDYPFEVSGAGESQPVADNSTSNGRALNRRVEVSIESTVMTEVEEFTTEIPDVPGMKVATGADGVEVTDAGSQLRWAIPSARLVDGNLIVNLDMTRLGDEVNSGSNAGGTLPVVAMPDGFDITKTNGSITLMQGSMATSPAFAERIEAGIKVPLADVRTNSRVDGDRVRTTSLIFPDELAGGLIQVGDTITAQYAYESNGVDAWRLLDIVVE